MIAGMIPMAPGMGEEASSRAIGPGRRRRSVGCDVRDAVRAPVGFRIMLCKTNARSPSLDYEDPENAYFTELARKPLTTHKIGLAIASLHIMPVLYLFGGFCTDASCDYD